MARKKRRFIAASDLAQLAYCEQKAVFEKRLGFRRTAVQARAADSGTSAHARFLADGLLADGVPARDRRCFIATAVFGGDAPETRLLRRFRDEVLNESTAGRLAVRAYYWLSPAIAASLERSPRMRRLVQLGLAHVVLLIQKHLRTRSS